MRNPVITVMLVIAFGFAVSHGVMLYLSFKTWPDQVVAPKRTPDLALPAVTAEPRAEDVR